MRLFNLLRLLATPSPPTQGVAEGAVYYDTTLREPQYHDDTHWTALSPLGIANPILNVVVPTGRQVTYFDTITNDGVLTIEGTGTLVGIDPIRTGDTGPQGPVGPPAPFQIVTGTPTVTGTSDVTGIQITIPANTLTGPSLIDININGFLVTAATLSSISAWISVNGTKQARVTYTPLVKNTTLVWGYQGQVGFKTIGASGTYVATAQMFGGPSAIDGSGVASQTGGVTPATVDTTQDVTIVIGVTGGASVTAYIESGLATKYLT